MLDTDGGRAPSAVARRAYDLADALLRERDAREGDVYEGEGGLFDEGDPRLDAPAHDPSWEVEPRWSRQDRASLDERLSRLGPGLAAVRPSDEADERTGS